MTVAAVQPAISGAPGPTGQHTDELARIRMEAAEWVVTLAEQQPAPEELAHLHAAWCAQDARHRRVYEEIERLWHAATSDVLQPLGPARGAAPATARNSRRAGLRKTVLGLAIAAGTGLLALQTPAVSEFAAYQWADQRTAVGEVRQITLQDGSLLTLNTHSAVDIDYSAERRTLRLRAGEVFVDVARDNGPHHRPFEVVGRDGAVRAMGTRYLVRQNQTDSTVTVTESTVQVAPGLSPGPGTRLHAGQQARFDRRQVLAIQQDAHPGAASWTQGTLVFNDAPLPRVLAELARYRKGMLRADVAALQHLRFTGVLPVGNPNEALSLLVDALPVKVTFYTDFVALVGLEKNSGPVQSH